MRTLLVARFAVDNLPGEVLTGPRRIPAGVTGVAVQDARVTASRPITGGIRREEGTFNCRVFVESPGAGEDAIDEARDVADDYLASIWKAISKDDGDNTIGGTVRFCDFGELAEDDQSVTDQPPGHTFACHVAITYTADVNAGA
jgi:hypothetical protein